VLWRETPPPGSGSPEVGSPFALTDAGVLVSRVTGWLSSTWRTAPRPGVSVAARGALGSAPRPTYLVAREVEAGIFRGLPLAIDDAWVYWIEPGGHRGTIRRIRKTEPATIQTLVTRPQLEVADLEVDGGWVYWSEPSACNRILRVEKSGGKPPVVIASTPAHLAGKMAVDDTHVYWVERDAPEANLAGGRLMAVRKQGGRPMILADVTNPLQVIVAGDHVFWSEGELVRELRKKW
jgi:hypothetical protein